MSTPHLRAARTVTAVTVVGLAAMSSVGVAEAATTGHGVRAAQSTTSPARPSRGGRSETVTRTDAVGDTGDSYISYSRPKVHNGGAVKLVSSDARGDRKLSFLKFHLTDLPAGARVIAASVTLRRDDHHLPTSKLKLHTVASTSWSQASLDARNAPRRTGVLARRNAGPSRNSLTFGVGRDVRGNGRFAFALSSTARHDVARFQSREAAQGPMLSVTYQVTSVVGTAPAPSPTPTPTTTPTAAPTPTTTPTAAPTPTPTAPSGGHCSLSAKLVPSCGILFGGALDSFGGSNAYQEYENFNNDSGTTPMTLMHDYRRPGQTLSSYDVQVANTPGAVLQLNWKPTYTWGDAVSSNVALNSQIDAMAASIKALGSHKIFLTLYHEPENDVSGGAAGCPSNIYKGSAGTPDQYRAMWADVEDRFDADGVTNVVWDMNYMGYALWDCMINDLWPGNSLVDWVFFESYSSNGQAFIPTTAHFYNLLLADSDADHDYLSKPWGIGEFGTEASSDATQVQYYADMKQAIDTAEFPRLKLMSAYDSPVNGIDCRVAYDLSGNYDPAEWESFKALSLDPAVVTGQRSVADSWS